MNGPLPRPQIRRVPPKPASGNAPPLNREINPPVEPEMESTYIPPQVLTPGGPVHGGFTVSVPKRPPGPPAPPTSRSARQATAQQEAAREQEQAFRDSGVEGCNGGATLIPLKTRAGYVAYLRLCMCYEFLRNAKSEIRKFHALGHGEGVLPASGLKIDDAIGQLENDVQDLSTKLSIALGLDDHLRGTAEWRVPFSQRCPENLGPTDGHEAG